MNFFKRQLPFIGVAVLCSIQAYLKAWPLLIFGSLVAVYMAIRQALFEHQLWLEERNFAASEASPVREEKDHA